MFQMHRGGELAKKGTYLDTREWEFVSIPQEGDYLPGRDDQSFVRVPLALMLVLGPILGLLFVIFLPMAVPLVVGMLLVQRLRGRAPTLRDSAVRVATYSQQPGMAYLDLAGAAKDRRAQDASQEGQEMSEGELEDLITKLEEDIARRREAGEE